MGARFAFVIDVDPALQRHPFPPLLLISLVENAIKHGIERTTGDGQITVNAASSRAPDRTATGGQRRRHRCGPARHRGDRHGSCAISAISSSRASAASGSLTLQDRTAGGVIATIRVPYEAAA